MAFLQRHFTSIRKGLLMSAAVKKFESVCSKFSTASPRLENYEGDGKTTVTILNTEYKHIIMVDTFSNYGFRLNNGIFIMGPMAVFPRTVLQWNVNTVDDLTPESLSLFYLLEPRLDLLLIGTGQNMALPKREVLDFIRKQKISVEILSIEQACSTFNFLNAEGRCVAGAMIPPSNMRYYADDVKLLDNFEGMNDCR